MMHILLETPVLLLLFTFFPAFLLIGRLLTEQRSLPKLLSACGGLCIGIFAAINLLNVQRPGAFWQDEPNILAIAAIYRHGGQMYHAATSPVLYSLLYGPATYLVFTPFVAPFAHPLAAVHLTMAVLNLATFGLLYSILREQVSSSATLGLLSVGVAFLLADPMHLLGVRGDPWLLFCVCFALWAALRPSWLVAVLGAGIFAGLAINFKVTVAPVVCLALGILHRRHGLRPFLCACIFGITTAASLFLLPHISLPNYLHWLLLSGHQGLLGALLAENLLAAFFLLAAGLAFRFLGEDSKYRNIIGLNLCALGLFALSSSVLSGSKDGAGPWHLWPLLPFLLFWAAIEASSRGVDAVRFPSRRVSDFSPLGMPFSARSLQVLAALAVASSVVSLRYGLRDLRLVHSSQVSRERMVQQRAESAVDSLVKRFSGENLAMGYGSKASDDRLADMRFELADDGEEYFLDENAEIEATKANASMPAGLLERILGCKDIWLIPHGELPFSTLRKGVLPSKPTAFLFPDSIRLQFGASHSIFESGTAYDLWSCPRSSSKFAHSASSGRAPTSRPDPERQHWLSAERASFWRP